jgi:arylsulfatase A-like enzyme
MNPHALKTTINLLVAALCISGSSTFGQDRPDPRPNVLLIVADDLGYADLGVYGSDIRTPNIDSIAENGVIFPQFHSAPVCSPARAMLLSGNNNHVAGVGRQGGSVILSGHVAGYEAHLSERIAPLPRLMRDAGYHTYMTGKWHLGSTSEHSPRAAGFERSYGLAHGAGSHFSSVGMRPGGAVYLEDGEPTQYPDGEYSTVVYTDRLLEFIDSNHGDDKPFFAFAAYTSPHWPLQVPDEYLDLYSGRYDEGYDALRLKRFESLKRAGIVPNSWSLPPRNDEITPWGDLTAEEQRKEARKMELYAAMVDNLDDHVGRLLAHLTEKDLSDNTIVVFMGDNGAAAEGFLQYRAVRKLCPGEL